MKPQAHRAGLLVRAVGDQLVVHDQARQQLHVLNPTTALVWRHCDGRHTVAELVAIVGRELDVPVDVSVIEVALAQLDEVHLLENRLDPGVGGDGLSRRQMLHWAASLAVGVLVPSITSCGSPLAPDAESRTFAGRPASLVNTTTTSASVTTGTTTTATTGTTGTTTTATTATTGTTTTSTTATTGTTTTSTTTTGTTTTTPAPKKVPMCHNGKTIMVDQKAVAAHLRKGDTLGPCPS